jgi:hypothetical protein
MFEGQAFPELLLAVLLLLPLLLAVLDEEPLPPCPPVLPTWLPPPQLTASVVAEARARKTR